MALEPQIENIKSSGIYSFEFDKSQTVSVPAEQIRMVIGFSKKGPFNTPTYVSDSGYFQDVFGSIDRSMERKGSFFHRTALAALERGPILALNLLRVDDENDFVESMVYSTSSTQIQSYVAEDLPYKNYFNRDKFWFPNDEEFLTNITNNAASDSGKQLLNLVNLGDRPVSTIVRKADPASLKGFDITAKEWYGAADIPDFLHKDDYISDFMVDIILIDGNFGANYSNATPYETLASDPLFAQYFDTSKGVQRKISVNDNGDTSLDQFLNLPEVKHVATYTGCLIPDFVDLNNQPMFVQDLVNADTAKTGLFCAINKEAYDSGELLSAAEGGLDLIGHNLEFKSPKSINFLSYKDTIKADVEYSKSATVLKTLDVTDVTISDGSSGNVIFAVDSVTNPTFYNIVADSEFRQHEEAPRVVGSYIQTPAGTFAPVVTKQVTSTTALFELSGVTAADFATIVDEIPYINYVDLNFVSDDEDHAEPGKMIAAYASELYADIVDGILTDGDAVSMTDAGDTDPANIEKGYLDFNTLSSSNIIYESGVNVLEGAITDPLFLVPAAEVVAYESEDFVIGTELELRFSKEFWDSADVINTENEMVVQTLKGSLNVSIEAVAGDVSNLFTTSSDNADVIKPDNYVVSETGGSAGPSRLTRITRVVQDGNVLNVTTVGKVHHRDINGVNTVEVYEPITEWTDYYQIQTLTGFAYGDYHTPDGTMEQQNNILYDTLGGTNLFKALIDKDAITFRYIVDGFGLGIESASKAIMMTLAKERGNAFAILNAPSMKNFKDSTEPSFVDLEGSVSTRMIADGGDLTKNPKVTYSLPGIPQGSNWGAFYEPYIIVRDKGKNITVPPAGYVSNNFIEKYASALPWSIVAGARRGVISGRGIVGIEYNLSKEDRDYLEPFGLNPIIYQSGTGIVIFGNKTAQQNIKSSLSSAHVREVLIYIQDGIAAILKNFIFEFNTAQTRLEILTLANNFMNTVKSDNGVYDYRNIMDETNNTSEVIDKNIGILDTYVEPVKGLEILVHRTTILKTGQIATGEFG